MVGLSATPSRKLDPRALVGNPVILSTEVVAALATVSLVAAILEPPVSLVRLADRRLALGHGALRQLRRERGRGPGQGGGRFSLRAARVTTKAKLIVDEAQGTVTLTPAHQLGVGQVVLVEAGDVIPADGEIIDGVASVNEAAITGESAPVIRESGGDRSAVTGGTTVVSDWIKVRVTSGPGSSFLDRMIAMVEGANRRKTPNEIALAVLLAGLTLVFLIAVVTLLGLGAVRRGEARSAGAGRPLHLSHSDDDRGAPVGGRHRRHGPAA